MENKTEKFLLEKMIELDEELKKVIKDKENITNALNNFKAVLDTIVNGMSLGENGELVFNPITDEDTGGIYNVLKKYGQDMGVISNEQ